MYKLLVVLMLASALSELEMSVSSITECRSRACMVEIYAAMAQVVNIDWRPISIFPNEAKRFTR